MEKKENGTKSNKCNQCDFASTDARNLKTHMKIHNGEKSNKCSQCDYASIHAGHLRKHLKIHTGEKSNNCNQCDFASHEAHLSKFTLEKRLTNLSYVIMPPYGQIG